MNTQSETRILDFKKDDKRPWRFHISHPTPPPPQDDNNRELKQTTTATAGNGNVAKGLMSRTMAVHVCYNSLYISLPFSAKQQGEITKFCVFWGNKASTVNILDFLMELIAGITYLVWAGFQTDLRSERV